MTATSSVSRVTLPTFRPVAPYHMVWLATNACNARCVHCSSNASKRDPSELTTDEAKAMLREMRELGVLDLAISGGEPLTRLDMIELIEFATDIGLRVGLGSNGSTISAQICDDLLRAGLHRLQISVDGAARTHDRARRWPGLFDRCARAVSTARSRGLRVHVCFTAHRLNVCELEAVVETAIAWGVARFNFSRLVPTGRAGVDLDLSREEWRAVVTEFEAIRRRHAGRIEFSTHVAQLALVDADAASSPGFLGCQAGIGQGCVGTQGEVMPCVLLPVVVGNVRDRPLREIWRDAPELLALRDRERLRGECGTCDVRERCGGCRAVAYGITGDYLETDPRCWKPESPRSRALEEQWQRRSI